MEELREQISLPRPFQMEVISKRKNKRKQLGNTEIINLNSLVRGAESKWEINAAEPFSSQTSHVN